MKPRYAVLAALIASWTNTAKAVDPYMWGVGPQVGTIVLPGRYPAAFPAAARDLSDDSWLVHRVKNDLSLGVDAVYYVNGLSRATTRGTVSLGLGEPFADASWTFGYQRVLVTGAMDVLAGGAAGFGVSRFGSDTGGPARLTMPYYPLDPVPSRSSLLRHSLLTRLAKPAPDLVGRLDA